MRLSMRLAGAAAAAVVLMAGFAAPANAAPPAPASVAFTQNVTPMLDSINASWGSFMAPTVGGFMVSDDTTALQVTLPSQLSSHFAESWDYAVRTREAAQTLVSGAVGSTSGTFTVPVPQSLQGFSELELLVTNGYNTGSVAVPVTLNAILHVHSDLNSTSAAIPLTKATATSYGRTSSFGSSPVNADVVAGQTITITSPPGSWTHGPDGDWATPGAISVSLFAPGGGGFFGITTGTASPDGSTVTVQIPRSPLTPYFPDGATSRSVTVQVTLPQAPHSPASFNVQAYMNVLPPTGPVTDRISGADRYEVALGLSYRSYPQGADTAFVVTGENYPDALSAAPAAVHRGAPLLLTPSGSLLPSVKAELQRLGVKDVYVVGGVNSVSESVVSQIEGIGATVHRIAGADRYEASRAVASGTFADSHSGLAYIATGANFPDALAAGGAAGHADAPVILVNGGAPRLDDATKQQLVDLGVTRIKIAGGPNSVSTGIEHDLSLIAPTTRLWGADRIEAAAAINLDAYGTSDRAFVVTGYKFPDALAGAAWAGKLGAPLYVSVPDCIPTAVTGALAQQSVKQLTLIGGLASLSSNVQEYVEC